MGCMGIGRRAEDLGGEVRRGGGKKGRADRKWEGGPEGAELLCEGLVGGGNPQRRGQAREWGFGVVSWPAGGGRGAASLGRRRLREH